MSVGIGTMSKGQLQQAIEKVANDKSRRATFFEILKGRQQQNDWLDYLEDQQALDSAAADYVRNTWQTMWQTYSYSAELVEAIMRQSLIEAIDLAQKRTAELALQEPMPIDCHWIWTDDQERFEVLITYNERQVLRILLTPRPPTNVRVPLSGLAPYWIVKPRGRVERDQEQELPGDPKEPWVTVQIKAP